ncbi:hypothetical protein D3C76_1798420 [compost metagenome]
MLDHEYTLDSADQVQDRIDLRGWDLICCAYPQCLRCLSAEGHQVIAFFSCGQVVQHDDTDDTDDTDDACVEV